RPIWRLRSCEEGIVQKIFRKALTTEGTEGTEDSECAVEQKFAVALGAENRRVDYICLPATQPDECLSHFLDGCHLSCFVTYNSALSNLLPADFELRFDQNDDLPATALRWALRERGGNYCGQHEGGGDE